MKLVIFDLGNTLIKYKGISLNWSEHYSKAIKETLSKQNLTFTQEELESAISILSFYNTRNNFRTFEIEEGEVLSKVSKVFSANSRKFERDFFEYFQRKTITEKTAMNTLSKLKSQNFNIAVLTDVPYGMPKDFVLTDLKDLVSSIDLVLTSCEVGFRKPESLGIKQVQSRFNAANGETFYIGDEKKDIECAQNSGIHSVLISENKEDWGQSFTINQIEDILGIVC